MLSSTDGTSSAEPNPSPMGWGLKLGLAWGVICIVYGLYLAGTWVLAPNLGDKQVVEALTPGVSTKADYLHFLEEGGLNTHRNWGTWKLTSVEVRHHESTGVLGVVSLQIESDPAPVPREVKDYLTGVCGIHEWKLEELPEGMMYSGEGDKFNCMFSHTRNSNEVVISEE